MSFQSTYPEVAIPDLGLHTFLRERGGAHGGATAFIDGPSGRTIGHAELGDRSRRLAAGLSAHGFGRGDVLGILAPNLPEWPLAMLGALTAGGAVTGMNPLATVAEIVFQLRDSRARMLLTVGAFLDRALPAAEQASVDRVIVIGDTDTPGVIPLPALLAPADPPPVRVEPERDVALLPYSSGTTGLPKGVRLTHRNVVANAVQCQAVLPFHDADVVVAALPFSHIAGTFATICLALSAGATVVTMPRFDLEQYLGLIERHRATLLMVAPPIVAALARHPLVDRFDLSSLQVVVSSAAPLSPELEAACAARLNRPVVQVYGMTEAGPVIAAAAGRAPTARRPGSAGVLLPATQAQLRDPDTGAACPPGRPGEFWVRGPQVMAGYLNNDEATAGTLVDGWLRTGDLGRIDADGQLFLLDRVKELIKVKGYQVAPAELEALLLEHPAVVDAAVIRRPDQQCGEVPVGYVIPRGEVSAAELLDHVAGRVAPYKRLAEVRFVAQIPRSPAGKILRRVLAEQAG